MSIRSMMRAGNVIQHNVLVDNEALDDVTGFELPSIEISTSELSGAGIMGTISMPTTGQLGALELTISYRSNIGKSRLVKPGIRNIEIRLAQDYMTPEGAMLPKGSKIFCTGLFKSSQGGSVENNNPTEGNAVYEVIRYRHIVDGVETLLIDKLAGIYKVNGVDYMQSVNAVL